MSMPSSPSASGAATVASAVARGRACGLDRLDAHLLLAHVLARPRTWLLAHGEEPLDAAASVAWERLLQRRASGEPLAYLVGEREFHGLLLQVDARVLVPRPDTEVLVDWGVERLRAAAATPAGTTRALPPAPVPGRAPPGAPATVPAPVPRPVPGARAVTAVDLGTGSGAIALAVKAACDPVAMHASDLSGEALHVARENARRHGLAVDFRAGRWWSPWRGLRFDVALANPPYIAAADRHLTALRHEPRLALVAGDDGLQALSEIVRGAGNHLEPGGWLLLEHGWDQADAVTALLRAAGLTAVETRRDLSGQPRCTGGQRAAPPAG